MVLILTLLGCGKLPACESLCEARAACVGADVAAAGTTWEAWTGFPDEDAYREACAEPFYASVEKGASRDDVLDLCTAEEATCEE